MNPINIGPRDIEAILAVARHGSFRAAAAELGIAQPSISARVRHAEDVLGVKLFHRTTRRVTITSHGERLVARAEQAMAELRMLAQEFRDESRLKRGRVVLGATPTIASALIPSIIQRFRERWPGIEVVLHDDLLGRALDRVHRGEIDFAVTPSADPDERFDCEPLSDEEFVLAAPKDHPLVQTDTVTLAQASKYPLLTLPRETATHEMLANAYAAQGLPFRPSFETHNAISVVALVKAGFGITFMPVGMLSMFDMTELGTAHITPGGLYRTVSITRAKGRAIQPAGEALIEALREGFQGRGKRNR
jgi:DNA-binding transcriptional LysR family regulator